MPTGPKGEKRPDKGYSAPTMLAWGQRGRGEISNGDTTQNSALFWRVKASSR